MDSDVIIIGGGASGLMAAITCARQGKRVLILEQKDRVGKKILATGNGKCNFTNTFQNPSCYRSDNKDFPQHALKLFGSEDTVAFFESLGIFTKNKNGYLYPNSGQASSILDVLRLELNELGVTVICGEKVTHVKKKKGQFAITGEKGTYHSKKVILCTGGKASPQHGSDGNGYGLAKSLGHSITKVVPALTGLKASDSFCKGMQGVRTDAKVTLLINGKAVCEDTGELQLTAYGVSGIPVFQICRFAGRAIIEKKDVVVCVDFFPEQTKEQLFQAIMERKMRYPEKSIEDTLIGILNKKVIYTLLKEVKIKPESVAKDIFEKQIESLCKLMKEMPFHITDTNGFEQAQVSAGGIDTTEIEETTMESKFVECLYFAGELVDVDGICGGYNLQWAWTSGYLAGLNAAKSR